MVCPSGRPTYAEPMGQQLPSASAKVTRGVDVIEPRKLPATDAIAVMLQNDDAHRARSVIWAKAASGASGAAPRGHDSDVRPS